MGHRLPDDQIMGGPQASFNLDSRLRHALLHQLNRILGFGENDPVFETRFAWREPIRLVARGSSGRCDS